MMFLRKREIFGILTVAAAYFVIFYAVQFNLAATTAALTAEKPTIVIDAGHGGEDGGAVGVSGIRESDVNLQIAKRLEQMAAFFGYEPYMLRNTDDALYTPGASTYSQKKVSDLKNRAATINRIQGAYLISIHQNHFSDDKYFGAQVFYADTPGSKDLANLTQQTLRNALDPANRRPCKKAESVYLLQQIQCPGILVECGFLSNSKEEQALQQPSYQKKITCAITMALHQYLQAGETEVEI